MGINQLVSLDFPLALITSKKESLIFTHKPHEPRTRSPLISWSTQLQLEKSASLRLVQR